MKQLQIAYENIDALVPYAQNIKNHDAENVGIIAASIDRFGFLDPIAIDAKGVIVWGHGRVLAAKSLGMATVPTITLPSTITHDEIRALRIAHNKLAEKSGWDTDALRIELEYLQNLDFDLSATGFDGRELDALLRSVEKDLAAFNEPTHWDSPTRATYKEQPDEDEDQDEEYGDDLGDGADSPICSSAPLPNPEFVTFTIIMKEDNQKSLIETLLEIKQEKGFDKIEDALMEMARVYKMR